MRRVVDPGQVLEVQVGVDLRGGNVGVAEQLLHRAQVAGGFQHVAGKRVAQQVRVDMPRHALLQRQRFQAQLHRARVDRRAAATAENRAVRRHALRRAEGAQRGDRMPTDRQHARLAALAEHAHFAALQIQLQPAQPDQLGQAQPAGVEQLQHRTVAQRQPAAAVASHQRAGLVHVQHLRQLAPHLRATHAEQRIMRQRAFAAELAKQAAAGRQQPLQAFRGQRRVVLFAAVRGGDKRAHQVGIQRIETGQLAHLHEAQQLGQVTAIGGQRVRRGMALLGQPTQPLLDLGSRAHPRLRTHLASAPARR